MKKLIAYKATSVQFEPTLFEKKRNIERLSALVEEAARDGAKLITTPEMGTTGYCWFDREEVAPYVEPINGPTTAHFHEIACRHDCYIVIGMPEVDEATGLYYNSAVLIGPEGVVGHHRKSHPYISEPKWSAPGDLGHQVFETNVGRIALLICMDIHFIETARLAAIGGADVICHISNWLAERTPAPYWISRAFENGCYLLESNRWGLERSVQFSGGSCVISPDGEVLSTVDNGDGLATSLIDLSKVERSDRLQDRRPELYTTLMSNTFSWNPRDFFGLYGRKPIPAGRKSRVAVGQFLPVSDVNANLERIAEFANSAATGHAADLLVLPELAISGSGINAEQINGRSVMRLTEIAASETIHIVAGFAEKDGDRLYNTAILVGPEGVVGSYRKIHLTDEDRTWASAGDRWAVFDIPAGRIGLMIGYDAAFPESGRILALNGCDIVACPASQPDRFVEGHSGTSIEQNFPIPTGADPHHWHHFRVRAGENNLYLAFANIIDPENGYIGKSGIFGPDTFAFPRQEAIKFSGEGLVSSEIDTSNLESAYPTNVVRRKDLVAMRLPHHYGMLVAPGSQLSK